MKGIETSKAISPIESERLFMREVLLEDAAEVLALFSQADCVAYIGDKGLKNEDDARKYIADGPRKNYQDHGIGLLSVCLKSVGSDGKVNETESGEFVGLCGLLKRDDFKAPDLGFAFLQAHQRMGYGLESAQALLNFYHELPLILGLTHPENIGSIKLLERLGFILVKQVTYEGQESLTNYFELNRTTK